MSVQDGESGYLTQQQKSSVVGSPQFNKTMGASIGPGSASRRPEIDHIINPSLAHSQGTQGNWILDNLSVFTS